MKPEEKRGPGRPRYSPQKRFQRECVTTAVRIPVELRQRLDKICEENGWTVSAALRWGAVAWLLEPRSYQTEYSEIFPEAFDPDKEPRKP